ncbi:hypothetical protein GDO86_006625 [Hymenochirus boettgeri]|uniref:Uncharacterized protein n=1 Tax=Hymenochirus boettgeri TaxID=247094 RepID=A0A8T2JBT4_9PIPI|nr:hypothetical protein GDO86_006625 [Hymenochirus boettgeri]
MVVDPCYKNVFKNILVICTNSLAAISFQMTEGGVSLLCSLLSLANKVYQKPKKGVAGFTIQQVSGVTTKLCSREKNEECN